MTLRNPQNSQQRPNNRLRSSVDRRAQRDRQRKRREKRKSLLENLEVRQLLAGPQLIGVQPNEGSLLFDGTTLNVSPREIVFQFDDDTQIDASTLSGIQITRSGGDRVFDAASVTSDLGTSGRILMEFRASQSGTIGNGITINFTTQNLPTRTPLLSVAERSINITLNSNPQFPSRVQDLISAINNHVNPNLDLPDARDLIEPIQVTGSSQEVIGTTVANGTTLTLLGANSAEAITDFGTDGNVRVRLISQLAGEAGRGIQIEVEQRNFGGQANPVVLVTDQLIRVQLNSAPGFASTAQDFITALNTNPQASALVLATLQEGSLDTVIGLSPPSAYSPLTLSGVSDEVIRPGFIGLGESPREVVFRFAEPLPDDIYQIDILGTGPTALRNLAGELFQDGIDLTRNFTIDLGPQVAAVVPEPVRRSENGSLSPETGVIEVHFTSDQLFTSNAGGAPTSQSAENPAFYQLIFTNDTVDNRDDVIRNPERVSYNNITNIATLDFGRPLSRIPDPQDASQFLTGAARLRIGTSEGLPERPTEILKFDSDNQNEFVVGLFPESDPTNPIDPGDSFATAFNLNTEWTIGTTTTQSARLTSEIVNEDRYELTLPGPDLPGTREIRPDDPSRLSRTIPLDYVRGEADSINGISVFQYDFADSYNSGGQTFFNLISEQQKQRVREALQLFSEYLGVNFVEVEGQPTSNAFFSIAVGDLAGGGGVSGDGGTAVVVADRNGDGVDDLGILDFRDFDESIDDQFGDELFRGAMFIIGQLLGYGYADDLPQPVTQSTDFIFQPGTDNEPAFPSAVDIVHGQYLYRPDSTDIDLYRFQLDTPGELSVETIAERLSAPSLLDTTLKLYQLGLDGSFVEIAQNDDYFSNDSLISLSVPAGEYMVGVSAKGNDNYDPTIGGTGFGGRSEGEYELRLDFRPDVTNSIFDTSVTGQGIALDGDADGRPGGFFDFWFVPADANNTLYVDKAPVVTGGTLGTVGNPYREIDQAIAAAQPGDTIRVIGNGGVDGLVETAQDNFGYQIGFSNNGLPLADGSSLDVPQGVQLIIDSGAILKMSRSRIGVGSVSPGIDKSDGSLQLLGTPSIIQENGVPARDASGDLIPGSVIITSVNDSSVGTGNSTVFTPTPSAGDWGGIDFRGDLDFADESRRNRENEGVFLNHIQHADLRYGGGAVSIGGRQVVVSPIDMAVTRPTIINSRITQSADAAIAATPDTFAETRFTDPFFQGLNPFTPDYTRVGPDIYGNTVIDNSINGLFIRLVTRTGDELETIAVPSRFDDTDIPHVLTENLVIEGTPGGPVIQSNAPSSLLVRTTPLPTGNVPAGTYVYRITNVNNSGIESAASQPTVPITLTTATGSVRLSQLPTVQSGTDFVSRRLYRAEVTGGIPGDFTLVAQLNASDTTFVDEVAAGVRPLTGEGAVLRSRLDASLVVDPGTVFKIDGARIESRFGGSLVAEGLPSLPIVFTSLEDQRYGGGGTFDTNDRGELGEINPGDWGGIYIGHGSSASIDHGVIAGGGGTTRIEGGFASFNALEVHQADLRLTNSLLELNADGRGQLAGTRVGRADNSEGTVFVSASQPIIFGNDFVDGGSSALSFDVNSLNSLEVNDPGRSTGLLDRVEIVGNTGPLIQNNSTTGNAINGLHVRGGALATAGVWDDVDMVHVVTESIEIPNQHIFGGLRLQSDARGSLVVKFESDENGTAGIVVGGNLIDGAEQFRDIPDRIGGALQIIGHPDFPVVLTTLQDDFSGAGFTRDGLPAVDTNGDGVVGGELSQQQLSGLVISPGGGTVDPTVQAPTFNVLPTGPEVNQGLTIDNDVDPNVPGFFEVTATTAGNDIVLDAVTVQTPAGLVLTRQDLIFQYSTYVSVAGTVTNLAATTITQQPTLIADDLVESRGTFTGPNGIVSWIAQSTFVDGVATLFSTLELTAEAGTLGDIRVITYLDEDVGIGVTDDILAPVGTPGAADFRAYTLDGPNRVGFAHGGFYTNDGANQVNATYVGWAADVFRDLANQIEGGTQTFSIPGDIDLADLPATPDPNFGTTFGPADVTTGFAWDTEPTATTSTVTSFLELLPSDPTVAEPTGPTSFDAGLWNGITIREAASDRNVAAAAEEEPNRTAFFGTNDIPSQSQFLGELAPNGLSGDENRRLGFIVDGSITTRDDLDVYSFIAESNTEVWLDIDRTGTQFDSVVELIDANGRVLASSNDSILSETNPDAVFVAGDLNPDAAQSLAVVPDRLPVQEIRLSESIIDSTGSFALQVEGEDGFVTIEVTDFLANPAAAVESALENAFGSLGNMTVSLLRRTGRDVSPAGDLTRNGDDFVVRLTFDDSLFIGEDAPRINISTVSLLSPSTAVTGTVAEIPSGVPSVPPAQQITISEEIIDSTGGSLRLSIVGSANSAIISRDAFLVNPALAVENAIESTFPQLGPVTTTLLARGERTFDPLTGARATNGGDFVVQVDFNPANFVGTTPPLLTVSTAGIIEGQFVGATSEELIDNQLQDDYTINPRDAGMRIRLPGEANTRNLYHIRVRSSNTRDPLDFDTLTDPARARDGLTIGRYELQVRIREQDERPGTQIRLADVRYATNGVQIIGQPLHSPILGEDYETSAANDDRASAQPLGYFGVADDTTLTAVGPLQSDLLSKSFAGELTDADDVDWYRFDVQYENLTRDAANLYLSTVFDLDYASNFARADMGLYVFDSTGALILVGGDSNVADDIPTGAGGNDSGDLSRGSAGNGDPYVGATELIEGTYFVAISNQHLVPQQLTQFFLEDSTNPLLRLEPVDSVQRIVEDHLDGANGTAVPPVVDVLFDAQSIQQFTLDDVSLIVNTNRDLFRVNPFTGEPIGQDRTINTLVPDGYIGSFDQNRSFNDVAFTANGELFGYTNFVNVATDTSWFYHRIDTGDASIGTPLSTGAGIQTRQWDGALNLDANGFPIGGESLNVVSNTGLSVEAITIREGDGFFLANRPIGGPGVEYIDNILYRFEPRTGLATGGRVDPILVGNGGAGTVPREVGQIDTVPPANLRPTQLGITPATAVGTDGVARQSIFDGDTFVLSDLVNAPVTFEFEQSFTLSASGAAVLDGDAFEIDGTVFEFDTGGRIQILSDIVTNTTTTISVDSPGGQTVRFELVRLGQPAFGNIPISLLDALGLPRNLNAVAADLAAAINANMPELTAVAGGTDVFFTGTGPANITVSGTSAQLLGNEGISTPGAIEVDVNDTIAPEVLIETIADVIRGEGFGVSAAGQQLALPSASSVQTLPILNPVTGLTRTGPLVLSGAPDVAPNNIPILVLPTDTAELLGSRIVAAIDLVNAQGLLPTVTALAQGNSVSVSGAVITNASGNLTLGGVSPGGNVTGVEMLNGALFAVTDQGALFRVSGGELGADGARQIGTYEVRATDLIGIPFSGLRAGPPSVEGGRYADILFGTTLGGDIYAFNSFGELQPIFAGGTSVISTGIPGLEGLDFNTLDFNLWHFTNTREFDPGHGISAIPEYRGETVGGTSLAFNYEFNIHGGNFGPSEDPFQPGRPRLDGEPVNNTYNFPGGAHGTVISNPFSLEGYSALDQPVLYFTYFLETDRTNDVLDVYVVTDDGTESLVASNTLQLFDNPIDGSQQFWRQARVSLGQFAGESDLRLRIDFSTNGSVSSTNFGSDSINTVAGDELTEGDTIVINDNSFVIDFAPTLAVPAGSQIADLYVDPNERVVITIDGQEYLLNDGSRVPDANQISINLLANLAPGSTIRELTAEAVATAISEAVRTGPPVNPIVQNFNFSDPEDDPNIIEGQNDLIFEATQLPYEGGNLTITGTGRLGTDPLDGPITHIDDVDLLRVNVTAGTTISVDVDLDLNPALAAVVRFFDSLGNELNAVVTADAVELTAAEDGIIFIGISGLGNSTYDPRVPGSAAAGQVDTYTAVIELNLPQAVLIDSNAIEFNGSTTLTTSAPTLFAVSGTDVLTGIPVRVSRFMSAEEVALQLQRSLANRFTSGDNSSFTVSGSTVSLPGFVINSRGPFTTPTSDIQTIPLTATRSNEFEGVYLDDFIIGFAERGERASNSNVDDTFVASRPPDALSTGTYQVEIRDASEYVDTRDPLDGLPDFAFRAVDTNDRLAENARSIVARSADEIRDGDVFTIFDGRSTVEFEFDLVESNTGSTPGRVRVPFTLLAVEPGTEDIDPGTALPIPGTGTIRPQTATEVARNIVDAINRSDVQSVIDIAATLSSGVDTVVDPRINLFGDVEVENPDQALADVSLNRLRGDDNRVREQGVILIENSRFLLNEQYGIDISHDLTTNINGVDVPSAVRYPRNLIELDTEQLKPGVVVQSSVFAFNGTGGLQISGIDPTINETGLDPVPFERIVNNTFVGGTIVPGSQSPSGEFQGIVFDQGAISFADVVVDYSPNLGSIPPLPEFQITANSLGAPDSTGRGPEPVDGLTTTSLGVDGSITYQFVNNLLTGSGNARPDLVVFETGAVESVLVEVSRDGVAFFEVGTVGGLSNQIDIDAAGFGIQDRLSFVRLTDLRQGSTTIGGALGADIDAVGALSTVPVDTYTAGGIGVNIINGAAPTLLNNVIANTEDGILLDPANALTVLGGNTFYRNTNDVPAGVSTGQFAQVIAPTEVVFTSPTELVFAPAAGSTIIDSSIDSLEDRFSLTTVRDPLGIPPSPIIAPRLDVNGQLRVDDPNVETPSGLGERVFKDRGASDRGDLEGPRAVLLSPRAPGLGTGAGVVNVLGAAPAFFEVQLIDGLAPADVTPGTGIDDRTIDGNAILVLQDNVALVEGVDYRLGYNPSTNIIRITPIAGVWELNSSYVIRMIDASDAVVAAVDGNAYTDGTILNVLDLQSGSTSFEHELGILLDVSTSLSGAGANGVTVTLFDGRAEQAFEIDSDLITDQLFNTDNTRVGVDAAGNSIEIAAALVTAINNSAALSFTATLSGSLIQLTGGSRLSVATSSSPFIDINGSIGTQTGFGILIPAMGAAPDPSIVDGQTFVVRRGALNEVTFELDFDNNVETAGATPVSLTVNPTLDEIADAIVRAVAGAGLGLNPSNAGSGRVFLGGDVNNSMDLTNSTLQQLGLPGEVPTVPVAIPIDASAAEVAELIAQAIDGAGIPNVSTTIVDTRVFIEGTGGVNGVGSVDLITIADEIGNQLQSNQANGRTELTIFVGAGYDFGDAPAPYTSLDAIGPNEIGGPRHSVDGSFSLGPTVTPDSNAVLPDGDSDDGVFVNDQLNPAFSTSFTVNINNPGERAFYLDAWFDWNGNGVFEEQANEVERYGSGGTNRPPLGNGVNIIFVTVPDDAVPGEIYARFRLSEDDGLGPLGDASSGEVEDIRLFVGANPYQNTSNQTDVNASGATTPLDALLIINALSEHASNSGEISLADPQNIPDNLPRFPDVDGSGSVTPFDALEVINRLSAIARGEAQSEFVATGANGVFATTPTAIGSQLISERLDDEGSNQDDQNDAVESVESKTSVFDGAAQTQLDALVDDLAADTTTAQDNEGDETDALDHVFAQL